MQWQPHVFYRGKNLLPRVFFFFPLCFSFTQHNMVKRKRGPIICVRRPLGEEKHNLLAMNRVLYALLLYSSRNVKIRQVNRLDKSRERQELTSDGLFILYTRGVALTKYLSVFHFVVIVHYSSSVLQEVNLWSNLTIQVAYQRKSN